MEHSTDIELDLKPLDRLTPDREALWGQMTPQHMVEHLEATFRVSNGELEVRVYTDEDRLPAMKRYLLSDRPFSRNIKNPALPAGLIPLRRPNLRAAVEALRAEVARFDAYHDAYPGATPHHPVGGPLTREEWLAFHAKHMRHHFAQFGLLEP